MDVCYLDFFTMLITNMQDCYTVSKLGQPQKMDQFIQKQARLTFSTSKKNKALLKR